MLVVALDRSASMTGDDGCYEHAAGGLRLIGPACDSAADPTPTVTVGCE